jgi:glycosyltransferase involved in cell wall biosynthesis
MKVGLDGSAMVVPNPTGVALAILRTATALAARGDTNLRIYYRISRFKKRSWIPEIPSSKRSWIVGPVLRRHGIDIFHGPDSRLPSALSGSVKKVTTIHDFSALQEHQFSKPSFRETRMKHYLAAVEKSDLIVCYTRAIVNELCHRFSFPIERTAVVPLAPAIEQAGAKATERVWKSLGKGPYVLVLGEISARKNTAFAIQSYLAARQRSPAVRRVKLVLAGRPGYRAEDALKLLEGSADGVIKLGYVDRELLPALIEQAQFLYFPSRYEGFGLPVVEAMSLGTPVLAGRCSAVSEVGGEALSLIGPEDLDEACSGFIEMVENPQLRSQLKSRGLARVAPLTWENSAECLWQAYEKIMSRGIHQL